MNKVFVNINNISKSFGNVKALKDISFSVDEGELFGLIGPDGAGKTTLIRILTTLLLPGKGKASINGMDVVEKFKKLRELIGYMPGGFSLYEDLTVEENLKFFATIFNTTIQENYDLIKDIYQQIEPFKTRRAGNLSGGMKQKLALSCALIHKPDILFLDEPTTGIDAVSRVELWDMLKKLKNQNLTIIVSTPYMDEAELCDRVALMQKGEVMEINTPKNIVNNFDKPIFAIKGDNFYNLLLGLRKMEITDTAFPFGESIHLTTKKEIEPELLNKIIKQSTGYKTTTKKIIANIEDCFMAKMVSEE
jgi:ABC-type multidrug transport system ATPase subunit